MTTRYRSLREALRADTGHAIAIATLACVAFAVQEYVSTLIWYAGSTGLVVKLRLALVVASLTALIWVPLLAATTSALVLPRVVRRMIGRDALGPVVLAYPPPVRGPRPGPARLWAGLVVGLAAVVALQRWAVYVAGEHKERQLIALKIALVAVVAVPVVVVAYRVAVRGLAWLARELDPVLGRWSPIGRWRGALVTLLVLVLAGSYAAWTVSPAARSAWATVPLEQFRSFPPWRTLLPLAALIYGGIRGARLAATLGPRRPSRRFAAAVAATALVVVPVSLYHWGAEQETKYVAVTASPALAGVVNRVRKLNDLDGDGFGSLLGENDCAPFDPKRHPVARDVPDNGIDENCDGRDFSLRDLARPTGDASPVPVAFRRPWNVLLLTVDTVRYDHTSFGGYAKAKGRDTTPELAKLVDRATSFTFAQAPSAGTMASIPAILTSKFFHSGIALDETKKPPKLKPENLLIGEVMKTAGYATGAITSHVYFKDWGMNQGMDTYDNELGKEDDPFKITSSQITDRALAWISRQHGKKWFLWAHYIDPHGRYVPHPDGVSYGTTEEDIYDGELHYTDHHIGRLLAELAKLPGGDQTIVVVTSDHGDGFGEHGFINHGQALYRELLHVPLIIAVPNNPARKVGGAVSGVDVLPTIAELCNIDVSQHSFEGKSLVPQIFYDGAEDKARVVFAETNYPEPIRAAISERQKLIYRLRGNIYELFDLARDPWEKSNLWTKDPAAGAALRQELDRWIERVLYSRDPVFNQAAAKISSVLMSARASPRAALPGVTFDDGRVAVLGADYVDPARVYKAGDMVDLYLYFEVKEQPSKAYRFQVLAWPVGETFDPAAAMTAGSVRTSGRETLDGLFATDRWRKGELIRDKFQIKLAPSWPGDLAVGIGVYAGPTRADVTGPHPGGDQAVTTLGVLPMAKPAPVPAVPAGSGAGSGTGSGSGAGSQAPGKP